MHLPRDGYRRDIVKRFDARENLRYMLKAQDHIASFQCVALLSPRLRRVLYMLGAMATFMLSSLMLFLTASSARLSGYT